MKSKKDPLLISGIVVSATLAALVLGHALSARSSPPLVVLGPAVEDLGTRLQNETITTTFPIRNTSSSTIKLLETIRSCGCTEPRFSKLELAPGETTQASLTLKTGSNRGVLVSTTEILYAADASPTERALVLQLTANIVPDYDVSPGYLSFGPDSPTSQTLTMTPNLLKDFRVTNVVSTNRSLQARVNSEMDKNRYTVTIFYHPELYQEDDAPPSLAVETNSQREPKYFVPLKIRREALQKSVEDVQRPPDTVYIPKDR